MATEQELSDFLKSVEKRAFKRSVYHVRDEEAALDIVQDSMMKLAEHYGDKPRQRTADAVPADPVELTLDWFRRQKTRNALFSNLSDFESSSDDGDFDLLETFSVADGSQRSTKAPRTRRGGHRSCERSRHEVPELAGPSTRSLPDALLGGHGRRRNGGGHGLLGRQCQDTLFARGPGPQ